MRALVDRARLETFMQRLGAAATERADCYLTGGATAVLIGWRDATVDIDLRLVPEREELLRAIARLKDELEVNVELVSPGDFIPLPEGSIERSISAGREGVVTFHHVDPYAQALSKIERGHTRDVEDVAALHARGLIDPDRLLAEKGGSWGKHGFPHAKTAPGEGPSQCGMKLGGGWDALSIDRRSRAPIPRTGDSQRAGRVRTRSAPRETDPRRCGSRSAPRSPAGRGR